MSYNGKKLGSFIVPTGIGATIGGYAGDAGAYARKFAKEYTLIVNPNVVNAGGFSAITDNMLYVEGYTLDSFYKGEINLVPSCDNKIGIIYDKAIPREVLNIHINTHNAVKTVYGVNVCDYIVTEENVGVEFYVNEDGISVGRVNNIETIGVACQNLLKKGCEAIAIVCLFEEPEELNPEYENGEGVDPVGGVEAILSHYVSKYFKVPCAHSPAFVDYSISSELINPKSASEYITPTFLPCILLGLNNAPKISEDLTTGINVSDVDFTIMPCDCLGCVPVFESVKRGIKIFAVKENQTMLNVGKTKLFETSDIVEVETYDVILTQIR